MKKFKLISTILLVALLSVMFTMPTLALEDPVTEANAVVLLDMATGNTVYSKNAEAQAFPASLTKVMTVMLALEAVERGEVSLSDVVTASSNITYDLIEDGSTANIEPGEMMSLRDLLYCAMVRSANEACNIIAEHVSGSISGFISLMNARAAELGCVGTNFANTHGIPNANHYTTAADFGKIALAAASYPSFMEICNTKAITIEATNVSEARQLVNTNALISEDADFYGDGYYYEYASGIKTGHTEAAGYCLASTAEKDGKRFLCVVMGGKATPTADGTRYGSFSDTISVYNWAFDNYSYRDILKMTDLVRDVPVSMGSEADFVSVHANNTVRALLPNDDDLQSFQMNIRIYSEETGEELVAPVDAGDVLGEISVVRDGVIYGTSPLVASTSIGLSYSQFISNRVGETLSNPLVIIAIIIVLALIAGYIFLVVRYRMSRRKYIQEQKRRRTANERIAQEREVVRSAPVKAVRTAKQVQYFDAPAQEPPAEPVSPEVQAERDYFDEFFGKK